MRIHILGIGGTFMAGLAVMAKELGHDVSGCDVAVYPPMSDILDQAKIQVYSGYDHPAIFQRRPDSVIVGNVISRSNSALEQALDLKLPLCSGPQWLAENVLLNKHVVAVVGTHGKTSTASMLAWILQCAGLQPGFLIGGAPNNFSSSVRLGEGAHFVIEADEYDTAYFDKRPKFMHYRPDFLLLNNLEFDHADIYPTLESIKLQFHYLLRCIPAKGCVLYNKQDENLCDVVERGVWSETIAINDSTSRTYYELTQADASQFKLFYQGECLGEVNWEWVGEYNAANALAASAAAIRCGGVSGEKIIAALESFKGVKRRLEDLGRVHGVQFYRDFAHHPTAIAGVLVALRAKHPQGRLWVLLQLGSRTMQRQVDVGDLAAALMPAHEVTLLDSPEITWDLLRLREKLAMSLIIESDVQGIVHRHIQAMAPEDTVVFLSNKDFANLPETLLSQWQSSVELMDK